MGENAATADDIALEIDDVSLHFGSLKALDQVSASIACNTIHSIIGPNGAGKTSLLNCLSGLYRPQSGSALLHTSAGRNELIGTAPHRMGRMGLARTFQNLELFQQMTVADNLLLGRHIHITPRLVGAIINSRAHRRQEAESREFIEGILEFLGLSDIHDSPANELPYGLQKQVELARALSLQPELLLLDEPMAGTTPPERARMSDAIHSICESGVTVVMIEHDMSVVMSLSDAITVLSFGTVIAEGTPDEVAQNPAVIEAYLGEPAA